MTGIPKDVTLKSLVDGVFTSIINSYEGRKIDYEKAWPSIWNQVVDEAAEYGFIVADTTLPAFPPMLKSGNFDKGLREQLLVVLKERLEG